MRGARSPIFFLAALILVIALQGYPMVSAQTRTLYGYVVSAATGKPVEATVVVNQCSYQQTTSAEANGAWQIQYPDGTLGTITFSAPGYLPQNFQLDLNAQWYYAGGVISLQPG